MVRIRMQRLGRHRRPFYRINAIDIRTRRNGAAIEQLGWYDPLAPDPAKQLSLNIDRVKYWLGVGAQPSETCKDFLMKQGAYSAEAKAQWEADRVAAAKAAAERKAIADAAPKDDKKKK